MSKKVNLAIVPVVLLGGIIFFSFKSGNNSGKIIGAAGLYMLLGYGSVVGGIILFLISLFIRRSLSGTLLFIFIATLNIAICVSAIVLYLMHQSTREWLHTCLLNGLIGAGMVLITAMSNDKN